MGVRHLERRECLAKIGKLAVAVGGGVTTRNEARDDGSISPSVAVEAFGLGKSFEGDSLSYIGWNHGKFSWKVGIKPCANFGIVCCKGGEVPFAEVRGADVAKDAIDTGVFSEALPERGA